MPAVNTVQLSLLPDLPSTPAARRGRGAVPRIERVWRAPRRNPAGRYELRFRFRPLQRHRRPYADTGKTYWELACNLLAEFFQKVGGFRLADDAAVRVWADALEDFTPQEIRWAVSAKAASLSADDPDERAAKRRFVCRPERFAFAYWLERSPHYQARSARAADRAIGGRVDEYVRRWQAEREAARAVGELAAWEARRRRRLREEARQRQATEDAAWDALTPAQRRTAVQAVMSGFRQYAANMGRNPEDPQLDALLRTWALDWARRKWPSAGG